MSVPVERMGRHNGPLAEVRKAREWLQSSWVPEWGQDSFPGGLGWVPRSARATLAATHSMAHPARTGPCGLASSSMEALSATRPSASQTWVLTEEELKGQSKEKACVGSRQTDGAGSAATLGEVALPPQEAAAQGAWDQTWT